MVDKSWIGKSIRSTEYKVGVINFLDFAFENASLNGKIWCPCISCNFEHMESRVTVLSHLLEKGFPPRYTLWYMHGEKGSQPNMESVAQMQEEPTRQYPLHDLLHDAIGGFEDHGLQDLSPSNEFIGDDARSIEEVGVSTRDHDEAKNKEFDKIKELLKDGNQELYDGCTKYTKLSFIVRLFHIKVLCGASQKIISMIIDLLKDAFDFAKLPVSFYEAKKMIQELGLGYEKIVACPNNCMLYWGEDEFGPLESRDKCKFCNTSKWELDESGENLSDVKKNKKPAKVLRYFPLIPRLQRWYMSSKTASHMKWHAIQSNSDGLLRHPKDSKAWKEFDSLHVDFASDPKNVRLALATDGFNPFGTFGSTNSIWPVMLYIYNLPPWMCMKQTSLIMSMIIPGPKMPGNNIDVYLQPLIAELLQLWNKGVDTYDSSNKEMFKMRAALMWTISDFPGLDNLSGWNTHTSLACPSCNFDTESKRLKFGKKNCYMGHRRFLPLNHKFRYNEQDFDGSTELRPAPIPQSGTTIARQIDKANKRPYDEGTSEVRPKQWKKKSIFWDLPYWQYNYVRHCLDMMHIEKNVCDNVLYTVLDDKIKTKDNLQARKDLEAMGIRKCLHPYPNSSKFPSSCFQMNNQEKDIFLKILKSARVPDGFSSNIARSVDCKKRKISGLKSHDSHILMEYLFPLALRKSLPQEVTSVLIELCNYFRELSSKVLDVHHLEKLQSRITLTLCHMEMIFPPSFFTIMVHLVIHLGEEAMVTGPVQFRWMYPIERSLGHLKSYVRNKAAPEGCIAEGYMMEECLTFCSRYLEDVETRFNRSKRIDDENEINFSSDFITLSTMFPTLGRPFGATKIITLEPFERTQAHRYLLTNCDLVDKFREKCIIEVKRMFRGKKNFSMEVEQYVHKNFHQWFKNHVTKKDDLDITPEIELLAQGPNTIARRFEGFNIHGFKFRTKEREQGLKTQNSGVVILSKTNCYSRSSDKAPKKGDVMYYGRLVDIIELDYYGQLRIVLFKCEWADPMLGRGTKIDNFGITSINFSRLVHTGARETDEPFIFASQARMVFYIDDPINQGWSCVCHMKPRDLYDMGDQSTIHSEDCLVEDIPFPEQQLENIDQVQLVRDNDDDNDDVIRPWPDTEC